MLRQRRSTPRMRHERPAPKAVVLIALGVLLLLAGIASFSGCGGSGTADRKIVIIGIDGMDWQVADPLLAEGRLPNLERIIDRGIKRELRSLEPRMKSPTIWATIATGKAPRKHGITNFVEEGEDQPLFNSLGWRALPVWSILGDKGYTVAVVNWMVSWPALPTNGYWISDRVGFSPEDGFEVTDRVTYPEELQADLAPYVRSVAGTSDDEIAYYLNGDEWRTTEDFGRDAAVESFRTIYAADQTIIEITKYLLDVKGQPRFLGVYLNGLDICCHRYWAQMDPSSVDIRQDEKFVNLLADLIPRYYERMDAAIGEIVERLDEDTTVIVCSDHGFRGPWRSPEGLRLGTWMHRPEGVLAAAGPTIAASESPGDASVFDITPTVLALLGEPVGRDMDGYVLTDIMDEEFRATHPVTFVDTYEREDADAASEEPVESSVDEEIRERLRSLGYIE
jgi:predicted AlkP superfamily phosphohydrolase/phosphomutase